MLAFFGVRAGRNPASSSYTLTGVVLDGRITLQPGDWLRQRAASRMYGVG